MYMTLEFLYKILLLRLFHPVFSCHFPDAQRQVADALMFTCHGVGSCAHLLVPSSQAFFEWLFQLDDEANLGKWLEITLIRGWKKRVPRPAQPTFSWRVKVILGLPHRHHMVPRPRWFRHFRGQIAILYSKKCRLTFLGHFAVHDLNFPFCTCFRQQLHVGTYPQRKKEKRNNS